MQKKNIILYSKLIILYSIAISQYTAQWMVILKGFRRKAGQIRSSRKIPLKSCQITILSCKKRSRKTISPKLK